MKILYTAVATASGREGRGVTSDGKLDLALSTPKELGGDGVGTNPEQLFAVGYAACFANAMKLVARRLKLDADDASVTAEVGIGANGEGGFALAVTLHVELPEHISEEDRERLVAATHQVCPYSNATLGNVGLQTVIE